MLIKTSLKLEEVKKLEPELKENTENNSYNFYGTVGGMSVYYDKYAEKNLDNIQDFTDESIADGEYKCKIEDVRTIIKSFDNKTKSYISVYVDIPELKTTYTCRFWKEGYSDQAIEISNDQLHGLMKLLNVEVENDLVGKHTTLKVYTSHNKKGEIRKNFNLGAIQNQEFTQFNLNFDDVSIPVAEIVSEKDNEKCYEVVVRIDGYKNMADLKDAKQTCVFFYGDKSDEWGRSGNEKVKSAKMKVAAFKKGLYGPNKPLYVKETISKKDPSKHYGSLSTKK